MSFVSRQERDTTYIKAVGALQDLIKGDGLDKAMRAAAEAMQPALEELVYKGYRVSHGARCANKLLVRAACRHGYTGQKGPCRIPGSDHTQILLKDGKPEIYEIEPYGLRWGQLQELVDCCRKYGLSADINAISPHFLGRTVRVDIRKDIPEP